MIVTDTYASPLGPLLLASDGEGLRGLWLPGQKYYASGLPETRREGPEDPVLLLAKAWLDDYFAGKAPALGELRLSPRGTGFQAAVWSLLREIPYGETRTYGALAEEAGKRLGRRTSARAVGAAVGRNPISILIPCHRVLGAGGSLTGYAGGLDKKEWLLRHEGAI